MIQCCGFTKCTDGAVRVSDNCGQKDCAVLGGYGDLCLIKIWKIDGPGWPSKRAFERTLNVSNTAIVTTAHVHIRGVHLHR